MILVIQTMQHKKKQELDQDAINVAAVKFILFGEF
jgi:hypothetical protein